MVEQACFDDSNEDDGMVPEHMQIRDADVEVELRLSRLVCLIYGACWSR